MAVIKAEYNGGFLPARYPAARYELPSSLIGNLCLLVELAEWVMLRCAPFVPFWEVREHLWARLCRCLVV